MAGHRAETELRLAIPLLFIALVAAAGMASGSDATVPPERAAEIGDLAPALAPLVTTEADTPSLRGLPEGSMEVVAKRTLTSKTYLLPDGRLAARLSTWPLHYEDAAGRLVDIDPTLTPVGSTFVNDKNTFATTLTRDGGVTVAHDGAIVTWKPTALALRDASGATLASKSTRAADAHLAGPTLDLGGIFADATQRVSVERSLVREELRLAIPPFAMPSSAEAVVAVDGLLSLSPGLQVRADDEIRTSDFMTRGSIEILEPDGTIAFTIYSVFATDASATHPQEGQYRARFTPAGLVLSKEIPAAWVLSKDRTYPVAIDPTFGWDKVEASVYVRQTEGNKNADNFLVAGEAQGDFVFCCFNEDDARRIFVRQDLSAIDNRIVSVDSAFADMWRYQWDGVSGTFLSHWVPSDSWTATSFQFSNNPAISGGPQGSVSVSTCCEAWTTTALSTAGVASEIDGLHVSSFAGNDQYSLRVSRTPETANQNSGVYFHRTGSGAPEWLVTYTIDATAPTTSLSVTGTAGENGWYRSSVSAALGCADTGGSGCWFTQYRINGGAWTTYSSAVSVAAQGTTMLDRQSADMVQNYNTIASTSISIDTVLPTTSAAIAGTVGTNGWYRSTPSVTLACADATSGCSLTQYRVNGGSWLTYSAPFTLATQGTNTLEFQSKDVAGNWATIQTQSVKVDTVAPSVSAAQSCSLAGNAGWCRGPVTLTPSATDATSGVASTSCLLDGQVRTCGALTVSSAGSHTFHMSATDSAGNSVGNVLVASFRIDAAAPSINTPGIVVAEAATADGSEVAYAVSATDATSGLASFACAPASGSLFALGDTTVSCVAEDAAGNPASASFVVRVQDTTPPTIDPSNDVSAEATGPDGAVVPYAAPATHDVVDGDGIALCAPASDSLFALGATTVTCAATDAAGNAAATTSFVVEVVDTTAPEIEPVADMFVEASGLHGAIVTYDPPTWTDAVDGAGSSSCVPASGEVFALGATLVTCDVTDAAGNAAREEFTVTVDLNVIATLGMERATYDAAGALVDGVRGVYHLEAGDGTPLADVEVRVRVVRSVPVVGAQDEEVLTGTTDENGDFHFGASPRFATPGQYALIGAVETVGLEEGAAEGAYEVGVVSAGPAAASGPLAIFRRLW